MINNSFIEDIQNHLNIAIDQLCKLRKSFNSYENYGQLIGDSISDVSEVSYTLDLIKQGYSIKSILNKLR